LALAALLAPTSPSTIRVRDPEKEWQRLEADTSTRGLGRIQDAVLEYREALVVQPSAQTRFSKLHAAKRWAR
jgi:hypothetical protein